MPSGHRLVEVGTGRDARQTMGGWGICSGGGGRHHADDSMWNAECHDTHGGGEGGEEAMLDRTDVPLALKIEHVWRRYALNLTSAGIVMYAAIPS